MQSQNGVESQPRITVLLATFNGRRWLPDQVTSILDQQGVAVQLVILDDGSTDGTVDWLGTLASTDPRVTILPADKPSGSAARNFYRLIERADTTDADLIALADQDDVWVVGKLQRHAALIAAGSFAAVS